MDHHPFFNFFHLFYLCNPQILQQIYQEYLQYIFFSYICKNSQINVKHIEEQFIQQNIFQKTCNQILFHPQKKILESSQIIILILFQYRYILEIISTLYKIQPSPQPQQENNLQQQYIQEIAKKVQQDKCIKAEINNHQQEIQNLNAQFTSISKSVEESQQQKLVIDKVLLEKIQQTKQAKDSLQVVQANNKKIQDEVNAYDLILKSTNSEMIQQQTKLKGFQEQQKEVKETQMKESVKLNESIEACQTIQKENTKIEEDIEEMQKQLKIKNEQNAQEKIRQDKQKAERDELSNKIIAVDTVIKNVGKENYNLEREITEKKVECSRIMEELLTVNTNLKQLSTEAKIQKDRQDKLEKEIKQISDKTEDIKKQLVQIQTEIQNLEQNKQSDMLKYTESLEQLISIKTKLEDLYKVNAAEQQKCLQKINETSQLLTKEIDQIQYYIFNTIDRCSPLLNETIKAIAKHFINPCKHEDCQAFPKLQLIQGENKE